MLVSLSNKKWPSFLWTLDKVWKGQNSSFNSNIKSRFNLHKYANLANEESKDITTMEKGVYESYGIGIEGFNISSCQFAFHYFFENVVTLENFMTNLSQCTKLGGHFIGGCYDGKTLFDSFLF